MGVVDSKLMKVEKKISEQGKKNVEIIQNTVQHYKTMVMQIRQRYGKHNENI